MQTATLDDLRNRLPTILAWLENGEDVVVKGKPAAKAQPPGETKVDWTQSAVFRRPPTGKVDMTEAELQEFYQDMRGSY